VQLLEKRRGKRLAVEIFGKGRLFPESRNWQTIKLPEAESISSDIRGSDPQGIPYPLQSILKAHLSVKAKIRQETKSGDPSGKEPDISMGTFLFGRPRGNPTEEVCLPATETRGVLSRFSKVEDVSSRRGCIAALKSHQINGTVFSP
jgi:hypothetical protein